MPRLPFTKFFPYVHPLKKSTQVENVLSTYKLPDCFRIPLQLTYGDVSIKHYLTAEKIQKSLYFLEANFDGKTLLKRANMFFSKAIYSQAYTERLDLHFEGIYFFWVYMTIAFLCINEYIAHRNSRYLMLARQCFSEATMYKREYLATYKQRRAAASTLEKKRAKENFVFELWKNNKSKWNTLEDGIVYTKLLQLYKQEGGEEKFGKFYSESTFTRHDRRNKLSQFAERLNSGE